MTTVPHDLREAHGTQPNEFRVVALLAAYNEADIIAQVIEHLIEQRIAVYLIDDGSSDGTAAVGEKYLHRGLIGLEQRAHREVFNWSDILRRKEALAAELDAHWFLHHDADELRESPWLELDLCDAIHEVDRAGFNAIDFRVFNFRPIDERFHAGDDLREAFSYYQPPEAWDRRQIKGWRKGVSTVDLESSGGHEVVFPDRRVCPVPFVLRHYPIRSPLHGKRKIFIERKPRFSPTEEARGWHVQYAAVDADMTFLWSSSALVRYDPQAIRRELSLSNRDTLALAAAVEEGRTSRGMVVQLEADARALREALDSREADARALRDALDSREAMLNAERTQRLRESRESATQLDQARCRLEVAQGRLEAAQRQAQDEEQITSRRIAELHEEIARARGEVRALLDSLSWRSTAPFRAIVRPLLSRRATVPAASSRSAAPPPRRPVAMGDLARKTPISTHWGFDRGLPIDRYYIQRFLEDHRADVRGDVLEVKDSGYTTAIGGAAVTAAEVLDVTAANPRASLIADLAAADHLPGDRFDCFILTQTLHIIYDCRIALGHAARLLKPGGVLLCTIPAVSRVNDEDGGLESGDYWRMTAAAVRTLFREAFPAGEVEITTYGNVLTCTAFLYGLATEEMSGDDLQHHDPWFPLIHCVRAVKRV